MSELPPVDKDLDTEGFCKIGWYNRHHRTLSYSLYLFRLLFPFTSPSLHYSPPTLSSPSPSFLPLLPVSLSIFLPLSTSLLPHFFVAEVQYYYKDQVEWKIIDTTEVQGFNIPLPLIPLPRPPSPSPGTQTFQSILVSPSHPQATPRLVS